MFHIPIPPEFYAAFCIYAFILGLFLGSFFNVCIYRIPMGMSVNKPRRSFCFRCGSMVKWYDNIPVVSYLVLGGRCRSCGSHFSSRYMLIEMLTGIIFLAVFMGTNPPGVAHFQIATFWYLAFASLLIVGTFTDIDHYIIPEQVTIGGSIAALIAFLVISVVDPWPLLASAGPFPALRLNWDKEWFDIVASLIESPFLATVERPVLLWWEVAANSAIGAVFGFALLYGVGVIGKFIFRKDAMGFGDVKLFVMIGATLGVAGCLVTLALASIIGLLDWVLRQAIKLMRAVRTNDPGASCDILEAGALIPESEEPPQNQRADQIALKRLVQIDRNTPRTRPVHYLPFGPSIALAAVLEVIFQQRLYLFIWNAFG